ncbi:MAG: trypsin-like serine protease, partial [Myxococcota bacterium]
MWTLIVGVARAEPATSDVPQLADPFAPAGLTEGTPDVDPAHAWAVGVCRTESECTEDTGKCSGTLVGPNLVLTARHCVDPGMYVSNTFCEIEFMGLQDPHELFVTLEPDPYGSPRPATWRPVQAVYVPEDPGICSSDVAILVLETPVSPEEAAPAWLDVVTNLAEQPPSEVAVVARGRLNDADDGGFIRRIVEHIPVMCVSDVEGDCTMPDETYPSGVFVFPPPFAVIAPTLQTGDSGSGMIDQHSLAAGVPRVVAVNTISAAPSEDSPAYASAGIRTSLHAEFLLAAARDGAALGGLEPPPWRGPPPEGHDTGHTGDTGSPTTPT